MKNDFLKIENSSTLIVAILVLLLFIVVYSCQKELRDSFEEKRENQAIKKAKIWYELNSPEILEFRSSKETEKIPAKPIWKNAFCMKNEKYEVVETDLMIQGIIRYIDKGCMEKYEETNDMKYKQSYSRLVFRTDKKTDETVGFLMTQVPNLEWLEKSNFKPFKKPNYLDCGKDFGGWILFHNLDGSFSNGWIYEKGKIVAEINAIDEESAKMFFRSQTCDWTFLDVEWESCNDWYSGSEEFGFHYSYTTCNTYWTNELIVSYCYDNGNGGGGYTGGGTPPSNTPDNPCISGVQGKTKNINMIANTNIKTNMDNILKDKVNTSASEWAVSIGRDANGTYYVSPAVRQLESMGGSIPPVSNGSLVSYGHSHGTNSIGVPSNGDLHEFLKALATNPSLESMYVYGSGVPPCDGTETYAINVHDRAAVSAFLAAYPDNTNWGYDDFMAESPIKEDYDNIIERYNNGYDAHGAIYPYIAQAVALSYIMSKYNMGVTLTRSVSCSNNNRNFEIMRAKDVFNEAGGKVLDITTCY